MTACTADEYELEAPSPMQDRICGACTVCDLATAYIVTECAVTSDRVCRNLTVCAATEFARVPATATSNRECQDLTVCADGTFAIVPATASSDRVCAPCASPCTSGFFERLPCNSTMNRVCQPCTPCDPFFQFQTQPCGSSSNRQCQNLTVCAVDEYQSVAPTASSDRTCRNTTTCPAGTYESAPPTATSDRSCAPISQCDATQYEVMAPTASANRVCSALTVCDPTTEYIAVRATLTTDRMCASLTVCRVYETVAVNATLFADRECTCFQSSDTNLTATLQLRGLPANLLLADADTQAAFVQNAVEAVLNAALTALLRQLDLATLVRLQGPEDIVPLDTPLATLPPADGEDLPDPLPLEDVAALYGLTLCSVDIVDVGPIEDNTGSGGGTGGVSRRAIGALGPSSAVRYIVATPTAALQGLACLLHTAGNSDLALFLLQQSAEAFVTPETTLSSSQVSRDADNSCLCGCVLKPPASSGDDTPAFLVYLLPILALFLVVLLLALLVRRQRRTPAYAKPPTLLPPYLPPPAFTVRLMPEHDKRSRDRDPWGGNRAPPYRPPPAYPGLAGDRDATAVARSGRKGYGGAPGGYVPRSMLGHNAPLKERDSDFDNDHEYEYNQDHDRDKPLVPPYREPPTYDDSLLKLTRQTRGGQPAGKGSGRLGQRKGGRFAPSGDDYLDDELDPLTPLSGLGSSGFLGEGYYNSDEEDSGSGWVGDEIGDWYAEDGESGSRSGLGPLSLDNPMYAGGRGREHEFAGDAYLDAPLLLPEYAQPPPAAEVSGTLSPPAYEEPPAFPF